MMEVLFKKRLRWPISSGHEHERCLEIGQIPNGFYDGVLIQNKEQSFDVIITVSAHLGVIYLFGVPKQVVFPDLAFLFKVREGMVSASFCFALKRDESGMIGPAGYVITHLEMYMIMGKYVGEIRYFRK